VEVIVKLVAELGYRRPSALSRAGKNRVINIFNAGLFGVSPGFPPMDGSVRSHAADPLRTCGE